MMNVKEAFEKIEKRFLEAGVDSPAFEVSVLMEDLLGLPRNPELSVPEKEISSKEEEKLFAVLERAAQRLAERRRSLLVTTAGETLRLPLHEIRFIEVQGNYVTLHAESPHTLRTTLKELTPQLDAAFFRTHRAFIVNLRFVRRATKTQVFLKDGTQVPLARGQYDALARALIAYF